MSTENISTKKLPFSKYIRRFSRKGSYDVDFNAPKFKVKSLCLEGIPVQTLERQASNEAVDRVLSMVGSLEHKNKSDVLVKVSLKNGIEVFSRKTKSEVLSYKIHQVGYCNVDKRYPQVFVFTAAKTRDDLKCHIFLCDDVAKAKAICLTMAKAFQNSFSNWQKSKEMADDLNHNKVNVANRRCSEALVIQSAPLKRAEMRRASDFVTSENLTKKLNIRRSSADTAFNQSSEDECSVDEDMDTAYQDFLSRSVEQGTCSLLRRESTDWAALEKDEEIKRKMQGDLILWED